jgi:hypothetical protein
VLRAKTYDHVTVVDNKKIYNCHFCHFLAPLFATLKQHIRQNHLEEAESQRRKSVGGRRRSHSLEGSLLLVEAPDAVGRPTRSRSDDSLLAATPGQGNSTATRPSVRYVRYRK